MTETTPKQQTVVDWLISELTEVERNLINKPYLQLNKSMAGRNLKVIFEQAKQLEKQQIIGTYVDIKMKSNKLSYGMEYLNKLAKVEEEAEKYYNNNFIK